MLTRTLILKVLYTASTLAGTMLVGLPAYAQISGTGTVLQGVNALPVVSVPGASPAYIANAAITPDLTDVTAFSDWVTSNAPAQVGVTPISPLPEGESVFVVYRFFVTDADGVADIKDSQAELVRPDGTIHTAYAPAKALGASSAITKEYYAQFEMKPTDMAAVTPNFYKIAVKVADTAIQAGGLPYVSTLASPKLFQYGQLLLLKANAVAVDFGNLAVGAKSAGVPITLTNMGNVALDSTLHATDLVKGSDHISAVKIWYGPTANAAGSAFPDPAGNAKRDAGFNLLPGASRVAYFAVDVPAGTPTGAYTTTLTLTGVEHDGAACAADCTTVTWS